MDQRPPDFQTTPNESNPDLREEFTRIRGLQTNQQVILENQDPQYFRRYYDVLKSAEREASRILATLYERASSLNEEDRRLGYLLDMEQSNLSRQIFERDSEIEGGVGEDIEGNIRPRLGIPHGQAEAARDLRNRILDSFPDERPSAMPEIPPQSLSDWNANFHHPVRKSLFLRKMPKELKKNPEEQALWLQGEIARLRREIEKVKKEYSMTISGFWKRFGRVVSRTFGYPKMRIEWREAKIVELLKKLRRAEGKLEREREKIRREEDSNRD